MELEKVDIKDAKASEHPFPQPGVVRNSVALPSDYDGPQFKGQVLQ